MNPPSLGSAVVMATLAMTFMVAQSSHAESATWNLNPVSGDWNTAANWTPDTVPNGPDDIATFGVSNIIEVSLSAVVTVDRIHFEPGANAFTITTSAATRLTLSGAGVVNDSGLTQNIVLDNSEFPHFVALIFANQSGAGSGTFFSLTAAAGSLSTGPVVHFKGNSSAESASFELNRADLPAFGNAEIAFSHLSSVGSAQFANQTTIFFHNNSTADRGIFTNTSAATPDALYGGSIFFHDNSTAARATFINEGATAEELVGGGVFFDDNSTAGKATFINMPSATAGASSARTSFGGSASGGDGTFLAYGGTVPGAVGGELIFTGIGSATAGNGRYYVYGGSNGGQGGLLHFFFSALGGTSAGGCLWKWDSGY